MVVVYIAIVTVVVVVVYSYSHRASGSGSCTSHGLSDTIFPLPGKSGAHNLIIMRSWENRILTAIVILYILLLFIQTSQENCVDAAAMHGAHIGWWLYISHSGIVAVVL